MTARLSGVLTVLLGAAGAAAGVLGILGHATGTVSLPGVLPLLGVAFAISPLGGFFMAVTGGVAVAAGIYSIGYGGANLILPCFTAALLAVPAASGVPAFLLCWELMAVTSLLLVLTEHRRRPEVAEAARWYAVMTHLGFACLLGGLLLPRSPVAAFLLCLAGFGSKAGIVPLHAWLPRAHPEAPSYVSALMSAAMVNMGVYGIIRFGFGSGIPSWCWLLVLALGALSAVYGILQAAMSSDLKRLLAYSTTENMGLALIGTGAAGLFQAEGQPQLAALALAAALLHVLVHATFKTALFLAAGSVLHAAGTRDLDALGGLRPRMPYTTAAFAWGALAASALPPGTAFVSEWLLFQALVHGISVHGTGQAGPVNAIVLPVAVGAVALTAGLAVATFVKSFGTGFLARPRSSGAARAHETPVTMRVGMGLAGTAGLVLAAVPGTVLPAVARAAARALGVGSGGAAPVSGLVTLRLEGIAGELSPLLLTLTLLAAVIASAAWLRALPARHAARLAPLWDCGGGPLTARMEYTATSFAEPLQRVFDDVLAPETGIDVTHADEARYLVSAVEYRRRVPDRAEHHLYGPVLRAVAAWGTAGRKLAPGSVHRYLSYGFTTVVALLVILAVTR